MKRPDMSREDSLIIKVPEKVSKKVDTIKGKKVSKKVKIGGK